jgi:hypothetical protein
MSLSFDQVSSYGIRVFEGEYFTPMGEAIGEKGERE